MTVAHQRIGPQEGPQTEYLRTPADIAIYGGAAGGGKTFGSLLQVAALAHHPNLRGVVFRRIGANITGGGGLWDESYKMFPHLGGRPRLAERRWIFPSGGTVEFRHLEHETSADAHQGLQYSLIIFDELTHFTERQFWKLVSRLRGAEAGHRPMIRCTCNPDPDSFVARLVEWYIDQYHGTAIPERSGVLRYFVRAKTGDELVWGNSRAELLARDPSCQPKSFTFIKSALEDNAALEKGDPSYRSNLMALPRVERERLLGGNWKVRPNAGTMFRREWFQIVDAAPANLSSEIRYWDRAATEQSTRNPDPDWTAGVRVGRDRQGTFYVHHVARFRGTPQKVEQGIVTTASQDGQGVTIGIEQDPGQAGVAEAQYLVRALAGYTVHTHHPTGAKVVRAGPASSQAEAGNIKLVRGPWNEAFLNELENFPGTGHDDQVDGLTGAINALTARRKILFA